MTTNELAKLVNAMRLAQKLYFRDRNQARLQAAKQLEGEVDQAVAEALEAGGPEARDLFEGQP